MIVLHQGAIGDFVLALSIVQGVRAATGATRVTAIASAPSARLAAGRSAVDAWRSPEGLGLHTLFCEEGPLDPHLSMMLDGGGQILNFLSGDGDLVHRRLQEVSAEVISIDPRPLPETLTGRRHITSQWMEDVARQGLAISAVAPARIRHLPRGAAATGGDTAGGERPQAGAGDPRRVLLHPGSGGRGKCWPVERYCELAERLRGMQVSWMLGPAEMEGEKARFSGLRRRLEMTHELLVVEDDFIEAAERMADADLYVGNDAGMTHVAAVMGVPTVAIFGPTDPCVWRPLGEHVVTVAPGTPTAIDAVSVGEVLQAIEELDRG